MEKFDGPQVISEFEQVFGPITQERLRLILKTCKHTRKFCRSNAALYNWANRSFPFRVSEVTLPGHDYPTMKIESKY